MKKYYFLILLFALVSFNLMAQKTTLAGINFTTETYGEQLRLGIGLVIERKLTRRSGIESGIYYRTYHTDWSTTLTNGSNPPVIFYYTIAERFVSLPILYKFYSSIVNLSAGLSFDFYMGYRQKNKSGPPLIVTSYNFEPNMAVGVQVKMSKTIRLDEKLILEPELRFNPVITYRRAYGGLGITAKYRLK